MKKDVKIIVFCVLTLILTYFGYKMILFINYKVDVEENGKELIEELKKSGETIHIKKNVNLNEEKLEKYKNIFYKSFDDNFELNEKKSLDKGKKSDSYYTYYLNKEDSDDYRATFKVGKTDYNLYDIFSSDDIFVYGFNLKNVNRKRLLDLYELSDSYDIIQYIINNYQNKVNIFSSSNQIKMNYFMKTFSYTVIPKAKTYLINGDYRGYLFVLNDDNYYEVHLFNDSDNYILSFINNNDEEYFNLNNVKEFISNIRFEGL